MVLVDQVIAVFLHKRHKYLCMGKGITYRKPKIYKHSPTIHQSTRPHNRALPLKITTDKMIMAHRTHIELFDRLVCNLH